FIENATEAHRGNGSLHAMAPQSTSLIDRSDRRRSFSRIDALDGGLNTTPIDAVAGAPQTPRVLDVRRSGPAHTKPSPQSSLVFAGAYLWRPSVGRGAASSAGICVHPAGSWYGWKAKRRARTTPAKQKKEDSAKGTPTRPT